MRSRLHHWMATSVMGAALLGSAAVSATPAATASLLGSDAITVTRDRKVTLDLHNADVRTVLQTLAEVGRVNIVVTDDVKGTVTMRLKSVSWQSALRAVLRSKGLDMESQGSVIFVAPAHVLLQQRIDAAEDCPADLKLGPGEFCFIKR